MEEIDIWRTAKLLIDSHGDGAWLQAAQRADKALEDGKPEIAGVWKRFCRPWNGCKTRSLAARSTKARSTVPEQTGIRAVVNMSSGRVAGLFPFPLK